jgi:hypothetical protein
MCSAFNVAKLASSDFLYTQAKSISISFSRGPIVISKKIHTHTCEDNPLLLVLSSSISTAAASRVLTISSYSRAYVSSMNGVIRNAAASATRASTSCWGRSAFCSVDTFVSSETSSGVTAGTLCFTHQQVSNKVQTQGT